jgi:hypothetical protein
MAVSAEPIECRDAQRCREIAIRAATAVTFLEIKTNLLTDIASMLEQFTRSLKARKHGSIDLRGDLQFHVNIIRLQSQHVFFKGRQLFGLWGSNTDLSFSLGRYHVNKTAARRQPDVDRDPAFVVGQAFQGHDLMCQLAECAAPVLVARAGMSRPAVYLDVYMQNALSRCTAEPVVGWFCN